MCENNTKRREEKTLKIAAYQFAISNDIEKNYNKIEKAAFRYPFEKLFYIFDFKTRFFKHSIIWSSLSSG